MKSRPNKNYILRVMRDGDIAYDPFGTAMSFAFACADILTVVGAEVPEELGYQPSPFVPVASPETYQPESYEDQTVWEYLQTGKAFGHEAYSAQIQDVQFAAKCLHRYIDWCKAAGRDY